VAKEVGMIHGAIGLRRSRPNAAPSGLSHYPDGCQPAGPWRETGGVKARLSVCDPGCQPGVTMA